MGSSTRSRPEVAPTMQRASAASRLSEQRRRGVEQAQGISDDAIYAAVLREVRALGKRGDALDFGAGVGNLLRSLHALGEFASVTGADLMPRPPALAADVRWVQCDLNAQTPLADESVDLIVSSEVIEHLENPRAVAREWFRLLRPGGALVLSTPNTESWRSLAALVLRGHFVAFGETSYPAHITALVRKDIERLLHEAGFDAVRFTWSGVGGLPRLPSVSWQSVSGGLLRGMRFSDNLVASARK